MFETPLSLFNSTKESVYNELRESAKNGCFYRIIIIKSNEKTVNYLKTELEKNGFEVSIAFNFLQKDHHRLYITWSL